MKIRKIFWELNKASWVGSPTTASWPWPQRILQVWSHSKWNSDVAPWSGPLLPPLTCGPAALDPVARGLQESWCWGPGPRRRTVRQAPATQLAARVGHAGDRTCATAGSSSSLCCPGGCAWECDALRHAQSAFAPTTGGAAVTGVMSGSWPRRLV